MAEVAAAPPPDQDLGQEITIPSSAGLMRSRRERVSRGRQHIIPDQNEKSIPSNPGGGEGVTSGLHAMLTPTNSTHPGGTTLSHIGTATAGPRIVIPLPAALTAATGGVSTPIGTTPPPLPTMLIDSEWFFLESYPPELRQYLATSYTFDVKPKQPGEVVEMTAELLRNAYKCLKPMHLNIEIPEAFKVLFDDLTSDVKDVQPPTPKHPYNESQATQTLYLVLAYILSVLLLKANGPGSLRSYTEVTYPGVIIATYLFRLRTFYNDVSKKLGLSNTVPYLTAGGRRNITETGSLMRIGDRSTSQSEPLPTAAINQIPLLATRLRIVTTYLNATPTPKFTSCSFEDYYALQDAALNVKGIRDLPPDSLVVKTIMLKRQSAKTDPYAEKVGSARCTYFMALLNGTIKPEDERAVVGIGGSE